MFCHIFQNSRKENYFKDLVMRAHGNSRDLSKQLLSNYCLIILINPLSSNRLLNYSADIVVFFLSRGR